MGHHKWSCESLSCPLTHLKALRLHLLDGRYVIKSNLWGCLCSGSPEGNGCTAQAFTFCFPPFRLQANLYAPPLLWPFLVAWPYGLQNIRSGWRDDGLRLPHGLKENATATYFLGECAWWRLPWLWFGDASLQQTWTDNVWINKIKKSNFLD